MIAGGCWPAATAPTRCRRKTQQRRAIRVGGIRHSWRARIVRDRVLLIPAPSLRQRPSPIGKPLSATMTLAMAAVITGLPASLDTAGQLALGKIPRPPIGATLVVLWCKRH